MSEAPRTKDVAVSDADLLTRIAIAVRATGSALRERYGDVVAYQTRDELMRAPTSTAVHCTSPGPRTSA
jgi:myo-inositol-1(or 4)-monophosphatase